MKKILFAATVLCMMGCQNKPTNSTPALDPSNMDTSVAPNESFYQYATGGWQAKNPLKPEHSSYNMFNVLNDNNEIRINELFTQMTKENPAKGTVNQKIADLYKLGLDSVRLNQEGAAPIRAELETILSSGRQETTHSDPVRDADDFELAPVQLRSRGRSEGTASQSPSTLGQVGHRHGATATTTSTPRTSRSAKPTKLI